MTFEGLERRASDRAERIAIERRTELARRIDEELPGVRAEIAGERVVLSGHGLRRRRLTDPALRWLGRWMR